MSNKRRSSELDAVLVSFRDPGDPMIEHEHRCFSAVTGLDDITTTSALTSELGERELAADLLLFGGSGRYSVHDSHRWLARAFDFLVEVAARQLPAWASCFGFQGLAVALGGDVVTDFSRKRLGAHPVELTAAAADDPLFRQLPHDFAAQFGHHDHVSRVPSGVTVLATGNDGSCLAMRATGSLFWGAQFHPELDKRTTLDRWSHYRELYAGDDGPAIDRHMQEAPDTPESQTLLPQLVDLALARKRARGV